MRITLWHARVLSLAAMILASILLLSSCRSAAAPSTPTPSLATQATPTPSAATATPPSLAGQALRALADVRAYQLDMSVSATSSATGANVPATVRRLLLATATLDVAARKMEMRNTLDVKASGQPPSALVETLLYLEGDSLYFAGVSGPQPTQWTKTPTPGGYWEFLELATQLVNLLAGSQVQSLPDETVRTVDGDVPSRVLQLSPDPRSLWNLVARLPGGTLPPNPPPDILGQVVSFDAKLWLSEATGLPVRSHLAIALRPPAPLEGTPSKPTVTSTEVDATINFHNYNEPVVIQLPPEALIAPNSVNQR